MTERVARLRLTTDCARTIHGGRESSYGIVRVQATTVPRLSRRIIVVRASARSSRESGPRTRRAVGFQGPVLSPRIVPNSRQDEAQNATGESVLRSLSFSRPTVRVSSLAGCCLLACLAVIQLHWELFWSSLPSWRPVSRECLSCSSTWSLHDKRLCAKRARMRLPVFAIFEVRPGCGFMVIYGTAERLKTRGNWAARATKLETETSLSDFFLWTVYLNGLLEV